MFKFTEENGTITSTLNGRRHSMGDLPAVSNARTKEWYANGLLHRDNGPAVIADGREEWWRNGIRVGTPAAPDKLAIFRLLLEAGEPVNIIINADQDILVQPCDKTGERPAECIAECAVECVTENQDPVVDSTVEQCVPTIEYPNGDKFWYQDNVLHRVGGPAVILANGHKEWCQYGVLHREDGPAIEYVNGDKIWYLHGKIHRDNDLPAVERANGDKGWYQNGQPARPPCRPFIELADTRVYPTRDLPLFAQVARGDCGNGHAQTEGFYRGHCDNEDYVAISMRKNRIAWLQPYDNYNYCLHTLRFVDELTLEIPMPNCNPLRYNGLRYGEEKEVGGRTYYKCGKIHRDFDLPAIERIDGTRMWYRKGKLHRDNDMPAIEHPNGKKEWYRKGKPYRADVRPITVVDLPIMRGGATLYPHRGLSDYGRLMESI